MSIRCFDMFKPESFVPLQRRVQAMLKSVSRSNESIV